MFFLSVDLDRVKVVNGMCSTPSIDGIENLHLLNVLNWSPLEDFSVKKSSLTIKDDNDAKLKNSYNAVQLSIELQKKMLK